MILAANWKLHKVPAEVDAFVKEFTNLYTRLDSHKKLESEVIIAPSPVLLPTAVAAAKESALPIQIFSQNCFWDEQGAFTGETSSRQLKNLGVHGTIIGHSERRTLFADSIESCVKRCVHALNSNLRVIFCVGETLKQREEGITAQVLTQQLEPLWSELKGFKNSETNAQLIVAYEPVWAIGTGRVASSEQISQTHAWLDQRLGEKNLPAPILYGGSVKASNFDEISKIPGVYGALVGGASLQAAEFSELLRILG